MKNNVLQTISVTIDANADKSKIERDVVAPLLNYTHIYSYLIYANYENKLLKQWTVEYTISQTDKHNTLKIETIIPMVLDALTDRKDRFERVISYKQPSIDIMLELYAPLIAKLAREQSNKWTDIEYEDAKSICKLTMLTLYSKGYYIHKHLLKVSFENNILLYLRHDRNKPIIFSLEQIIHRSDDNDSLTLADVLQDKDAELKQELEEEHNVIMSIFDEVKNMIIDFVGERRFEQLLRDYGNKHTTSQSRKTMQLVKNKFNKLGITWKVFERYYQ